jgi:hypothetical protein
MNKLSTKLPFPKVDDLELTAITKSTITPHNLADVSFKGISSIKVNDLWDYRLPTKTKDISVKGD